MTLTLEITHMMFALFHALHQSAADLTRVIAKLSTNHWREIRHTPSCSVKYISTNEEITRPSEDRSAAEAYKESLQSLGEEPALRNERLKEFEECLATRPGEPSWSILWSDSEGFSLNVRLTKMLLDVCDRAEQNKREVRGKKMELEDCRITQNNFHDCHEYVATAEASAERQALDSKFIELCERIERLDFEVGRLEGLIRFSKNRIYDLVNGAICAAKSCLTPEHNDQDGPTDINAQETDGPEEAERVIDGFEEVKQGIDGQETEVSANLKQADEEADEDNPLPDNAPDAEQMKADARRTYLDAMWSYQDVDRLFIEKRHFGNEALELFKLGCFNLIEEEYGAANSKTEFDLKVLQRNMDLTMDLIDAENEMNDAKERAREAGVFDKGWTPAHGDHEYYDHEPSEMTGLVLPSILDADQTDLREFDRVMTADERRQVETWIDALDEEADPMAKSFPNDWLITDQPLEEPQLWDSASMVDYGEYTPQIQQWLRICEERRQQWRQEHLGDLIQEVCDSPLRRTYSM